jgi:GTPase Era involved in 16S rRNA processing
MMPQERYTKLKEYLSEENPVLLDVISSYETLDNLGKKVGFLPEHETYTSHISWWPMISLLGTFSAGKSTFINHYMGENIQESGNQAIDDKFTVLSYGNNKKPTTLPGLALDADPRFPFYNISEEVNKVDPDRGDRVNTYLQLKTLKSEKIKGHILIDSPGFDADSQRDSVLRITKHIVEMSDLVLVFFDARHPEPGAMRDTLKHLVHTTIGHKDSNKILYILNQIDTSAKDNNLEDVISSWQRALANEGLISGNFYTIYNENAANKIDDTALAKRLKEKKDTDLGKILERMAQVKTERAYRIIKSLEDVAKGLQNKKIPLLQEVLKGWWKRVIITDVAVMTTVAGVLGLAEAQFGLLQTLFSSSTTTGLTIAGLTGILLLTHTKARSFFAKKLAKKWRKEDKEISEAILFNTMWWKLIVGAGGDNWHKSTKEELQVIIEEGKRMIQKLNDQHINENNSKSKD